MKKLLSGIVSIALIFNICIWQNIDTDAMSRANQKQNEIVQIEGQMEKQISDSARNFMSEKYETIIKMVSESSEELNIPADSLGNATLGEPFLIYDLDAGTQYEEIHFPVVEEGSGKVIFVVTLYGTTYGWQYKVGTEMVEELNLLEYDSEEPCVFYEENEEITGQSLSQSVDFSDDTVSTGLSEEEFIDAANEALDNYQTPEKVDIEANSRVNPFILDTSTSAVSELGYYYLILQNSRGQQGGEGLCWAATVATIVNYKLDKKLTALQVANAMGIDVDRGAYIEEAQDALRHYGLYFIRRLSYATFDMVKLNIQRRSPMYMRGSGYNSEGKLKGHAVTIYGYKEVVGEQSLMIWDSAVDGNSGGTYMISYNGAGTVYSSAPNTIVFTWQGTLLNYK